MNESELIDSTTRTCQIIGGALIMGVVSMVGVATVIDPMGGGRARAGVVDGLKRDPGLAQRAERNDVSDLLKWLAVGFTAVTLPLSFWLPRWITAQNRRSIAAGTWAPQGRINTTSDPTPFGPEALKSDTGKLAVVYQTQFIIGAALNEGPAFFAVIAYMMGRNPIALGLAAVLLAAILVRFPTRVRVGDWMERQQELLEEDRLAAY